MLYASVPIRYVTGPVVTKMYSKRGTHANVKKHRDTVVGATKEKARIKNKEEVHKSVG